MQNPMNVKEQEIESSSYSFTDKLKKILLSPQEDFNYKKGEFSQLDDNFFDEFVLFFTRSDELLFQ